MNFVYLDEQHCNLDGKAYTAVHGVIIASDAFLQVRESFFSEHRILLNMGKQEDGTTLVDGLPVLHGADLLGEFEDSVKLQAVDGIFSHFVKAGAKFIRVGYYHHSIEIFAKNQEERTRFAVINILLTLRNYFNEPYLVVHEIDREGLRRMFKFESDDLSRYYNLASLAGWKDITVDYRNMVGHFVDSKTDLGCQMADIVGLVARKAELAQGQQAASPFTQAVAAIYAKYHESFIIDALIEMKEQIEQS